MNKDINMKYGNKSEKNEIEGKIGKSYENRRSKENAYRGGSLS
jgi:hypothetical protein